MDTKLCTKCKVEKPLTSFKRFRLKNGWTRRGSCRDCNNTETRNDYKINGDKYRDYASNYRKINAEKYRANKRKWWYANLAKTRKSRRQWKNNNQEKTRSHTAVASALKRGLLKKPLYCEFCGGKSKLEGSHHDYNKPLDVKWLCNYCHRARDSAIRRNGGYPPVPLKLKKLHP